MKSNIYTIEQLEKIQDIINELINYAEEYDKTLPYCFNYCRLIIKNIEICKNESCDYIERLSEYIKQDWKSAILPHRGLKDYYIVDNDFEKQKNINSKISEYVDTLDKYINDFNNKN